MDEQTLYQKLARRHIAAVEAEVKGVRLNRDLECVHRMRVALRRLKNVMTDFQEMLPTREYEALIIVFNRLLRALGQARDIDTKIAFLNVIADDPRVARFRPGILEIIDELAEDRAEIQPKIVKNLARLHQRRIFAAVLRLRPSLEGTGITLEEWAKNRVLTRLEKLSSFEPYARRPGCIRELHAMRVAAKNLRYTMEHLALLYGRKARTFALAAMKVQRSLGEVHNFDVWIGLLKILGDSSGRELSFRRAVKFLSRECQDRRVLAYKSFLAQWTGLRKKKTWARLGFFALDRV